MLDTTKHLFSIKEVSAEFNLSYSTLRFWESQFKELKPVKNNRGVRYYNAEMLELLRTITYLTRQQGYTLDGVKKYLFGEKHRHLERNSQIVKTLEEIRQTLLHIKQGME
ncbi:MAG: MerR family transcriptional regulator [Bacteroidales bacterium]|jgi:DNA-binding transcriptional MerR regulator|nr:MerR family transcriptional regulator [Bacteroidales bacterium]